MKSKTNDLPQQQVAVKDWQSPKGLTTKLNYIRSNLPSKRGQPLFFSISFFKRCFRQRHFQIS